MARPSKLLIEKITNSNEQVTEEYQSFTILKVSEALVEAHGKISSLKQENDIKLEKLDQKLDLNLNKFEMILNNKYEELKIKIDEEIKRRIRDKNEQTNEYNSMREKFDKSYVKHNAIEKGLINLGEISAAVIEILTIQSCLDEQDEKDRKSISLWGINQKFPHKTEDYTKSVFKLRSSNNSEKFKLSGILNSKQNYNVITVDKNWYSCTNPNSVMLNAFKMACLSYFPSEVKYNSQYHKRIELHDKKIYIVKNLKNQLSKLYPWIEPNWNYLKYINILNDKDLQTFDIDDDSWINKNEKSNLTHPPSLVNMISTESLKEIDKEMYLKYIPKSKVNKELKPIKDFRKIFKNSDIRNRTQLLLYLWVFFKKNLIIFFVT